jgi:RNA polymerase sigma factor (sigma-70 family)
MNAPGDVPAYNSRSTHDHHSRRVHPANRCATAIAFREPPGLEIATLPCHVVLMDGVKQRIHFLRNLLRRRGRSRHDADDLIQEAFLRLHLYCRDQEIRKQDAFLARTVFNLSVDLHRKEHRGRYCNEPLESLLLVDVGPTPDEYFAASQRLEEVLAVLDGLTPRTREIFLMHRIEGHSCGQIATHFGISVSAVEKQIAKAVLSLMDVVEHP